MFNGCFKCHISCFHTRLFESACLREGTLETIINNSHWDSDVAKFRHRCDWLLSSCQCIIHGVWAGTGNNIQPKGRSKGKPNTENGWVGLGTQRLGVRSHLEQGGARHTQQVHSYGEFPEELSGNVTQPSPLQPVQDKIQVGSDLDSPGPLIERSALTCGGRVWEAMGAWTLPSCLPDLSCPSVWDLEHTLWSP